MSQPQMNMGGMGGPVGGAPPSQQQQQQAGTPTNPGMTAAEQQAEIMRRLNTYIYDYFLRGQHYDIARAMHQSTTLDVNTVKHSPGQRQNQPNGVDDMDTDRPKDLPEPNLVSDAPHFLQDWWLQFWDIYNGRRNIGGKQTTLSYLTAQRAGQKQRGNLMGAMDPAMQQNMRNMSMMNNGMMPNDLKKAAMQNAGAGNMNPQQLAQMQRMRAAQSQQQMMQGSQMERSNSQMEMNGPRSGSPGSGDAPSPKRQRLDGNVQQMGARPGQQGQMPNSQVGPDNPSSLDPAAANHTRELLTRAGIDPGAMPPEQFNLIAMQPTNTQRKSVDLYSHQMQQSTMNALNQAKSNMNKGMPPNVSAAMGPAGTQGSPMSQAGMDASLADFQNGAMRPGMVPNPAVAAAGGQPGPNAGNHALQDYQMQLMLLEQQNKKRLLMARQEQDSMSHPGIPPGANGQFAPNMSPQGSRAGGPSPNPNEMARGTPKMQPGASPNGQMQGRASPAPGFDPSQGVPPNMRNQMVMGPNGQMMPRSHPQFAGQQQHQLTHGQLEMLNRQAQMMPTNGTFPGGAQPMPPNMMPGQPGPGQQPGQQPGQGPPNMTPRQGNQAMPPPPAPQPNATGGTQPSSPAAAPAPPTPNQSNKAKPGSKKDNKNNKKSATKKGGQTGATPASEAEQPPTPTPATPITPMNQNSFQKGQQGAPNGGMPNGGAQQQPPGQQQNQGGNGASAPGQEPFGSTGNLAGDDQFGSMGLNMNMDFADPMANTGGDVLDNFDFDSFLNTDDGGLNGFDNFSFDTGLEAGGDGMGQ